MWDFWLKVWWPFSKGGEFFNVRKTRQGYPIYKQTVGSSIYRHITPKVASSCPSLPFLHSPLLLPLPPLQLAV